MKSLTLPALAALLALALAACGASGPAPTPNVAGAWLSPQAYSKYVLTGGGALAGDAYWHDDLGGFDRVGSLAGTVRADGTAEWVVTLSDGGQSGTETVAGRFSGERFEGTFTIRRPDGTVRL